ncbi:MAG: hypothetical protein ACK6EB_45375, partial [Planctomyces sp.]
MHHPPDGRRDSPRHSGPDPWKPQIDELLKRSPELSASRIHEEIKSIPDGYCGGITVLGTMSGRSGDARLGSIRQS